MRNQPYFVYKIGHMFKTFHLVHRVHTKESISNSDMGFPHDRIHHAACVSDGEDAAFSVDDTLYIIRIFEGRHIQIHNALNS